MRIILLYGPPSSGKGTHARLLSQKYHYPVLEPARIFRDIASNPNHKYQKTISEQINNGFPTPTHIYTEIVQEAVSSFLQKKTSFIMDKPGGSLINEAKKFLRLIKQYKPEIFLFILDIPLAESLRRIESRFFVPSTGESRMSYQEALQLCKKDETPIQRIDDNDTKKVHRRYKYLYQSKRETIINLFHEAGATITHIDAQQDILTVQKQIDIVLS